MESSNSSLDRQLNSSTKMWYINIATINCRSARNCNLQMTLKGCQKIHIDLAVITETKLDTEHYTKSYLNYNVIATQANLRQGGVALEISKSYLWQVEYPQCYGPNVIAAFITSGNMRWIIVGVYLPPGEEHNNCNIYHGTMKHIEEAIGGNFKNLILLGDLNSRLNGDRPRDIEVSVHTN